MTSEIPFGRYKLLDRIGQGGMAELYFAKVVGEAGFEMPCVIKRVLPHLANAPGFLEMFLEEGRLTAQLRHPGVVQIFDLGKNADEYYLAMEYLPGEDLHSILAACKKAGKLLPIPLAAKIVAIASEALHFVHEARGSDGTALKVVHRDISPSNIFVTYLGSVKVLDFGIARASQRLELTQPGIIRGKTAYLSPEQLEAKPADRKSDVWSLGVVLHEALTDRRLFARRDPTEIPDAVCRQRIPLPREIRPEIPEPLEAIVMSALQRDPAKRLQSAGALFDALEGFLADASYAPNSTVIAQFLKDLFGEERARSRLERFQSLPPGRRLTDPSLRVPALPVPGSATAPAPAVQGSRKLLWAGVGVLGAVALIGIGHGLRSQRSEGPATPTPSAPPVIVAPSAPAPLKPPVAPAPPDLPRDDGVALAGLDPGEEEPELAGLGKKKRVPSIAALAARIQKLEQKLAANGDEPLARSFLVKARSKLAMAENESSRAEVARYLDDYEEKFK